MVLVLEGVLVTKWFVLRTKGMLLIAWYCIQSLSVNYASLATAFCVVNIPSLSLSLSRRLREMDCFSNFDRVRGWFDTEFQDSEGFTVSSA